MRNAPKPARYATPQTEIDRLLKINADLLAALEAMLRECEPPDFSDDDSPAADAIILARSAIVKAKA